MKTEFIKLYEELDALNEVFTYTEDEILSDEELKEVTAKVAELEPKYNEVNSARLAKLKELKAAGVKLFNDVEFRELADKSYDLGRQLSPFKKKLDRHNEIIKYKTATDSQVATEEDGDRILGYEGDVEVDDLEIEVYREESEYESGGDSMHDSIIYTTVPAQSGYITSGHVSVEVTKEQVAEFLNKEVSEITTRDIMDLDEDAFTEYLAASDEIIDRAIKEAEEAADSGDYDSDDVSWDEDDDGGG